MRHERSGIWPLSVTVRGLSPRVRGNRAQLIATNHKRRAIPTCAGEPSSNVGFVKPRKGYPHVCGGTKTSINAFC